jgi:hypothetical protein
VQDYASGATLGASRVCSLRRNAGSAASCLC